MPTLLILPTLLTLHIPSMVQKQTMGWGVTTEEGVEIWDSEPIIRGRHVTLRDWGVLLLYPKKFLLYRHIMKAQQRMSMLAREHGRPFRILDAGCGTGAAVIDLKKIFGSSADVVGIDVVKLQVELARKKVGEHGVVATVEWYDGAHIPFPDASFNAIYTSDVLGHVVDVPAWLDELERVLRPGGTLAMFAESTLGKHAWVRTYLFKHGLNADPHAPYHISLFSKKELQGMISRAGFDIEKMYGVFWPAFLLHPEEFYPVLQAQKKFPLLRFINKLLTFLKKKMHPYSTAAAELYGLVEMLTIGRWVESQGYIVLAEKIESRK